MMHNGFGQYGNWLCGPGTYFPGPFGWIITLLFWGLVIYLGFKLFGFMFAGKTNSSAKNLETLKERYARGDVSEEEYNRMKTELS